MKSIGSIWNTVALAAMAVGVALVYGSATYAAPPGAARAQRNSPSITPLGVATSHYQNSLPLTCNGPFCNADLPSPRRNTQLVLSRIACSVNSSAPTSFDSGFLSLFKNDGTLVLIVPLPLGSSSAAGEEHLINQAIDVLITSQQHVTVFLNLTQDGTATSGVTGCSVAGTLYSLE